MSQLKRGKGPTRSVPKRLWKEAREKIGAEGVCRVCGRPDGLEAAHTIGRNKQDTVGWMETMNGRSRGELWVNPASVIPLCKTHHEAFDSRRLDILPYLDPNGGTSEQEDAVRAAGGIESARRRLCPSAYRAEHS